MNKTEILHLLDRKHIPYRMQEHAPAHTIEEIDGLGLADPQTIVKNLFLRDDKKKNYYLVTLCRDKTANLKELRSTLGSRPLSFGSENDLYRFLGLRPGQVTPLGLLNDSACAVHFVADSDITAFETVGVHPNDNTATVWLSPADLLALIREHGNPIMVADIKNFNSNGVDFP